MPVHYRFANRDEYPKISQFLDEHWAKDHVYVRNRKLFDWTFGRNEVWPEDTYSFAMAEDAGELVGILGGIPFTFNHAGEQSPGVWIVNYVIREDRRRGPMALQLLGVFRKPPFRSTIAFGINPATATIYKALRGEVLAEIPRHFAVLSGGEEQMSDLLHVAHPQWESARIREVVSAFETRDVVEAPMIAGRAIPEDWDSNDWLRLATCTTGAVRDSVYLNWRYLRHPCFEHHVLTVPENGHNGLAIWRLETIRRSADSGDKSMGRIARLLEFIPVSRENARQLAAAFLGDASQCGAFAADYYGYHGGIRELLADSGLRAASYHPDGDFIPTRFQPLDGHTGVIMSAMFVPQGLPACSPAADCTWYWTKSDSDQDRPN
ncbi:MAG TPA: hypothetical protein VGF59_03700 [Bryobacteraceae bacterium]|jgi:hypothetical protein